MPQITKNLFIKDLKLFPGTHSSLTPPPTVLAAYIQIRVKQFFSWLHQFITKLSKKSFMYSNLEVLNHLHYSENTIVRIALYISAFLNDILVFAFISDRKSNLKNVAHIQEIQGCRVTE